MPQEVTAADHPVPRDGMVPPGGFVYPQPLGGGTKTKVLSGDSEDHLIEVVTRFRVQNRIEVGDPRGDVHHYRCSQHPGYCKKPGVRLSRKRRLSPGITEKSLLHRIFEWVADLWETPVASRKLAGGAEVAERARICLSCPARREWRHGCPACVSATDRSSYIMRKGRDVFSRPDTGCSHHGWDLRLAVLLENPVPISSGAPPGCWATKNTSRTS